MTQPLIDDRARRAWPIFRSFAGWRLANLGPDLLAGLTLAAIAIPAQMATARLGGFPPVTGFIVFIAGTLGFAALGSSGILSVGADSTIAPIFASSLALMAAAGTPAYVGLATLLAAMTGAILLISGLCRLGWIASLLSIPVMTGFLAGIAVHIVASQLPTLLQVPAGTGEYLIQNIVAVVRELGGANPYSVAIGIGVFVVTFAAQKIDRRIPGALIALVGAILLTTGLGLEQRGVASIGAVAGGLPSFGIAIPAIDDIVHLVPLALIVTAVMMVQTAATARAFATGDDAPDISRDFVGVGAGGILSGLAGGFAVNASPPSTGAVSETGGRSQLAGLTAAAIVAALLLFGTGLLAHVPTAALAGILFYVALRLVRVSVFVAVWRQSRAEFALIVVTMAAIVVLPIQTGVGIGIMLSLIHGIWTIAGARPVEFERIPGSTIWWPAGRASKGEKLDGVLVLGFQAPLAFLNVDIFARDAQQLIDARPGLKLAVLEASSIVEIDFTAAQGLAGLMRHCRARRIDFAVARLESTRAQDAFDRFGLRDLLGDDHLFHSVQDALVALAPANHGRSTA
jgi:sulfate permease, SulP family